MAGNEQEQDRSEAATSFKLKEAKKRGQVAKSMEFTSWLIMLGAAAFSYGFANDIIAGQLHLSAALFSQAGSIDLGVRNAMNLFSNTLWFLFSIFWMFIALIMALAIFANFLQTGPIFSWTPLKPDFSRINPAAGFKKLFNVRLVYEGLKTILKLILMSAVVYAGIKSALPRLMALLQVDIKSDMSLILQECFSMAFSLLAVAAFMALLDFAYVKWDYAKKMRMSRRELKEEVKRRDGDPQIKAKIRELQREAAKRGQSLSRIPEADVLLTNPTHLSVAIRYERGVNPTPLVIAKGAGELALKMRIKARQHNVHIVENKILARLLFKTVDINRPIPPEAYAAVARILTWIEKQNRSVKYV